MSDIQILAQPLSLPCGAELPNRFAKGAMTEQMANLDGSPIEGHVRLYRRWGQGGTGMLLTGNMMVDGRYREHARNIVVENEDHLAMLSSIAQAGQEEGSQCWVQLSHPGRQCPKTVTREPVAPSEVELKGLEALFSKPRALTEEEIEDIIERFATSAAIVKKAGFMGVQVHSAHGYLSSQFLSPRTNKRTDQWGGSLENRMRFLLSTVRGVRAAVGAAFPVSVKLNSADYQRGGFTEEESMEVVSALEAEGIDLLEISGGSYEEPAMMGTRASTVAREAYFAEYAENVRKVSKLPLMLTGGFRTGETMAAAVESGAIDVVGMARPLAVEPDLPKELLAGQKVRAVDVNVRLGVKLMDDMLQSFWYGDQIRAMSKGAEPNPSRSRFVSLVRGFWDSLPK